MPIPGLFSVASEDKLRLPGWYTALATTAVPSGECDAACDIVASTQRVESRYGPYHIGLNNPALGAFTLDDNFKRCGWRQAVPNDCTPDSIMILCSTVGTQASGAASVRIRVCKGLAGDPTQPDLTGGFIRWFFPDDAPKGWQEVSLHGAIGPSLTDPIAKGEVLHVVIERQTGTLSPSHSVTIYAVRSRFPLQFTYQAEPSGESTRDDLNVFMYTPDNTNPATEPYCAYRGQNASMHGVWFMKTSAGNPFGNPFDVVEEELIYGADGGAHSWANSVLPTHTIDANFLMISMRGAGPSNLGHPQDDLYLTIRDEFGAVVYGPAVYLSKLARLFQGRPHQMGNFLAGGAKRLTPDRRWIFSLSSPGSSLSDAYDAYLLTVVKSTLAPGVFTNAGGVDSFALQGGVAIDPRAVFGFMIREHPLESFAVIDEFGTETTDPPLHASLNEVRSAPAGDRIKFKGITRNIGKEANGIGGGEFWVRLIDVDTGLPPPGYSGDVIVTGPAGITATLVQNDENTVPLWNLSFDMPSADVHLRIETGHAKVPGSLSLAGAPAALVGELAIDDWSPYEVRLET